MEINENMKGTIRIHADSQYPEECCGLIVNISNRNYAFVCKNIATHKRFEYDVDPHDYLRVSRYGKIVGTYHSQCGDYTEFSVHDKINAEGHNLTSIMYHPETNKYLVYTPSGKRYDYFGRKFEMGKSDCFSLISDYYRNELDINLTPYFPKRDEEFFAKTLSVFSRKQILDMAVENGFNICNSQTKLKMHDLLFMATDGHTFPSHLAVYIPHNKLLEQLSNNDSGLNSLDDSRRAEIKYIFRHKNA